MTAGSGGSGAGRPARARPDDCDIRHDRQSRACRGARPGTGDLNVFHGMTRDVAATVAPSPGRSLVAFLSFARLARVSL